MRSGLRWGAALLMVLCVLAAAGAQEVSEKKDIAVFNLSYSDYSIPSGALGLVDQSIQNVFIELGRFNIIGMKYRLELNEIDEFISKIKELKQENVEVPEEVRLGEETFTEADFNKLVGSFIVVVPVMSYYNVYEEGNDYQAEIQTSFTFIKVDTAEAFASFQIDTSASGENSRKAVKSAVDMIPIQLQYELRSIPEFQLKTAIIDVAGNKYIMEFGRNMGVQVGDEYVVTRDLVLPSGYTRTEEVGLFVIKNVSEQVSTAKRVYSSERTGIGDQMVEVPRLGVNATIYGHYLPVEDDPGTAAEEKNRFVLGLRGVGTRGFYNWRPVAGVEYNVRIGRLSLVPSGVVGVGSMVPIIGTEEFKEDFDFVSSFGGTVQIAADYLINRDTKINLYAGYSMYISLFDDSLLNALTSDGLTNPAAVQGSFIGAGITFKL